MRTGRDRAFTRRGFLGGAGAAASLAALAQLRPGPAAAQPRGARFFDAEAREILAQVVERMVETGDPEAPRVRETATLATIEGLCAGLDPGLTAPLPRLLRLVDWGPLLFEQRLRRFTRLSPAEQDASLRGWMTSRFHLRRLGFLALRNLALVGYYTQPETWPRIGYAGRLLDAPEGAPWPVGPP